MQMVSFEERTDALTVAHLCSRPPRTKRNGGDVYKNLVQIVLLGCSKTFDKYSALKLNMI